MRRVLLLLLVLVGPAAAVEEVPRDVRSELRALDPPWYDTRHDTWRRVRPPPAPDTTPQRTEGEAPLKGGDGREVEPRHDEDYRAPVVDASDGLGSLPFTALIVVVVAALLAGVAAMIYTAWKQGLFAVDPAAAGGEDRPEAPRLVVPHFLDLDLDEASRQDIDQALRAAMAAGDWPRAVVCCFAAELVTLDAKGLIHLRRGTTNRGFLRELAHASGGPSALDTAALARDFAASMTLFEGVYFGGLATDRAEVEAMVAHLDRFRAVHAAPTEVTA